VPGNHDPRSFWRAPFDEAVGRLVAQLRAFQPDVVVTYDAYGLYGHPDHLMAHRVGLVAAEASAIGQLYPEAGEPWRIRKVYLATVPRSFTRTANTMLARLGLPSPFADPAVPENVVVGVPDEWVDTIVDVRSQAERKFAALQAHRTQVGPRSFFLNLPAELYETAYGTEWFLRQRSDVEVPAHEDDLFTGLA
jgi:LmbE family N-acetylglucosaminyl deacetylase